MSPTPDAAPLTVTTRDNSVSLGEEEGGRGRRSRNFVDVINIGFLDGILAVQFASINGSLRKCKSGIRFMYSFSFEVQFFSLDKVFVIWFDKNKDTSIYQCICVTHGITSV